MIWEPCHYSIQASQRVNSAPRALPPLTSVESVRGASHPQIDTCDLSAKASRLRNTLWHHRFPDSRERCATHRQSPGNQGRTNGLWAAWA